MRKQAEINKTAWEHQAYEFWKSQASPVEKADYIKANPMARLRYHQDYFCDIEGKKIANLCGSNGRIATPLALLKADVTVFDISEENKRYALELANAAGVSINYVVTDICEIDTVVYGNGFDILYAEGGILHYFSNLTDFMKVVFAIAKPDAQFILSDFHPYRKINNSGSPMMNVKETEGDYFDTGIHEGAVAYASFYDKEEQNSFPKCLLRHYTLSEIINAVIASGFILQEFHEHPNFENKKLPGLFTIVAKKQLSL